MYVCVHTPSLVLRLLLFIRPRSRSSLRLNFSSSVSRGRPLPRLLWLEQVVGVCTSLFPTLVFSPNPGPLPALGVCLWPEEEVVVEWVMGVAVVAFMAPSVCPSAICWFTTLSMLICIILHVHYHEPYMYCTCILPSIHIH